MVRGEAICDTPVPIPGESVFVLWSAGVCDGCADSLL